MSEIEIWEVRFTRLRHACLAFLECTRRRLPVRQVEGTAGLAPWALLKLCLFLP